MVPKEVAAMLGDSIRECHEPRMTAMVDRYRDSFLEAKAESERRIFAALGDLARSTSLSLKDKLAETAFSHATRPAGLHETVKTQLAGLCAAMIPNARWDIKKIAFAAVEDPANSSRFKALVAHQPLRNLSVPPDAIRMALVAPKSKIDAISAAITAAANPGQIRPPIADNKSTIAGAPGPDPARVKFLGEQIMRLCNDLSEELAK